MDIPPYETIFRADVPGREFVAALKAVLPCAGTDDTLPVLTTVAVRVTPGQMVLETTDRYMLAQRTVKTDGADHGEGRVYVAGAVAKALVKLKPAGELLHFEASADGRYTVTVCGTSTTYPPAVDPGSQYPNLQRFFDNFRPATPDGPDAPHRPASVRFNPEFLARFAKMGAERGTPLQLTMPAYEYREAWNRAWQADAAGTWHASGPVKWELGETAGMIMPIRLPE